MVWSERVAGIDHDARHGDRYERQRITYIGAAARLSRWDSEASGLTTTLWVQCGIRVSVRPRSVDFSCILTGGFASGVFRLEVRQTPGASPALRSFRA